VLVLTIEWSYYVQGTNAVVEEVISWWEVSEGSTSKVLRVLNVGSAEIGNTFWELATEAEGAQTKGDVSIKL
jgi:hypothetical protein